MLERLSATIRIIYNYAQTLPNADEMINKCCNKLQKLRRQGKVGACANKWCEKNVKKQWRLGIFGLFLSQPRRESAYYFTD
jgi:hypothetical protein